VSRRAADDPFVRLDTRLRVVEAQIRELESWLADMQKRLDQGRSVAAGLRRRMAELIESRDDPTQRRRR
jgi:hypothetical protein